MAGVYERTLTVRGVEKHVERFADSLKNSRYSLDGIDTELPILKVEKTEDSVSIYLYFDDGVVGNISNIRIFDNDDEEIIKVDDYFTKESHKGFYVLFKYKFVEEVNHGL